MCECVGSYYATFGQSYGEQAELEKRWLALAEYQRERGLGYYGEPSEADLAYEERYRQLMLENLAGQQEERALRMASYERDRWDSRVEYDPEWNQEFYSAALGLHGYGYGY